MDSHILKDLFSRENLPPGQEGILIHSKQNNEKERLDLKSKNEENINDQEKALIRFESAQIFKSHTPKHNWSIEEVLINKG